MKLTIAMTKMNSYDTQITHFHSAFIFKFYLILFHYLFTKSTDYLSIEHWSANVCIDLATAGRLRIKCANLASASGISPSIAGSSGRPYLVLFLVFDFNF